MDFLYADYKEMRVDVLLICYNQSRFIQKALESIFFQRVNACVRIIVADDGSTDDTLGSIRAMAQSSPFEMIFLPEVGNQGISKNYQRAFEACESDYIAILEGDDYWCSPYHLKQHIEFLDEHRECSMSMNQFLWEDDKRGVFSRFKWGYPCSPYYVSVEEQIVKGNQLGNLSACVLRTSCVKKLSATLFDMPLADWMLGVMLAQQGFLAILETPTSVYRTNSRSVWASKTKDEQLGIMLSKADEYDAFQDGKYHDYWQGFKRNLLNEGIPSRRGWLPPFILSLMRGFVPPAIKQMLKRHGQ